MEIHVVAVGETIEEISNLYGVSVARLLSDNRLPNPYDLVIGQTIVILFPKETYTVRNEDTILSISEAYNISQLTILQNNPSLLYRDYLYEGETIVISYEGNKLGNAYVNGYAYPFIDEEILISTLPYLTYLTIFGYGFLDSGELIEIQDERLIQLAYKYKTAPVLLFTSITEDGKFDTNQISILVNDINLQNVVINNLIAVMKEKAYVGIDVDFEFIAVKDKEKYLSFLENITDKMNNNGFFVNVDLAPKISDDQKGLLYEAHDYGRIGDIVNTVLLMTYEWGYAFGPPMAVAPINSVRRVVEYGVSRIDNGKIYMGIPNYGYDWQLPYKDGNPRAITIGNVQAVEMAAYLNTEILFDEISMTPYFYYTDDENYKHVVWFEDARSIKAKLQLANEFNLRGVAYWNIMRAFPQNYLVLNSLFEINKVI